MSASHSLGRRMKSFQTPVHARGDITPYFLLLWGRLLQDVEEGDTTKPPLLTNVYVSTPFLCVRCEGARASCQAVTCLWSCVFSIWWWGRSVEPFYSVANLNGAEVNCLNKTEIYWTTEALFYFSLNFLRGRKTDFGSKKEPLMTWVMPDELVNYIYSTLKDKKSFIAPLILFKIEKMHCLRLLL